MTDGGASATVAASIGRARAMRMALLAEPLSAPRGVDCGLVTHVAPDDAFPALVDDARPADWPPVRPLALAAIKKAINAATLPDLEDALERERTGQRPSFATADVAEGPCGRSPPRTASPVFRGE